MIFRQAKVERDKFDYLFIKWIGNKNGVDIYGNEAGWTKYTISNGKTNFYLELVL